MFVYLVDKFSILHSQVVGHSVEVESSGVGNVPSNGEQPTCCVEAAESKSLDPFLNLNSNVLIIF